MQSLCLVLYMLCFISIGCSQGDEEVTHIIQTPHGDVTAKESVMETMPQEITVVHDKDLMWLQGLRQEGPRFVSHYHADNIEPELDAYDAAFRAWQEGNSSDYSAEDVIRIIGGYLGNRFVVDFDMEWVVVSDQYGTDYAVRSKKVEAMAFPFSMVLKRIEEGKDNFVFAVYYSLRHTIETVDIKTRSANESE
jgi:hypothetical protein